MGLLYEHYRFIRFKDTPEDQFEALKNSNTSFSDSKISDQVLIGFSIVNESKEEIEKQGKTIDGEKWEILEFVFNALPENDKRHASAFMRLKKIIQ